MMVYCGCFNLVQLLLALGGLLCCVSSCVGGVDLLLVVVVWLNLLRAFEACALVVCYCLCLLVV